ncbi:MAG TPA: bifunctional diaminohydroxyphosphoribosylaminopyrimidine deaminase/5-amino-6-(5-phosphoribosylamino)uracil reductase RibD [Polyangia bacterium]|jgi:diaminohydroxyphosphoribosylaminopyrimidine deaminase/5-amino-6-(5-phosphoribosylamino)uracil reductase|nr:bifunctional diaminohydroxyphosphoribosylaminopyrimidine deaminase/5-amino-6-(5-phosphoribosylamino)uracil reductase RibD [Polyangia bacterium]
MSSGLDEAFMREAMAEGERARGRTSPNPWVGCVLVRGKSVIARGFTQPPGGAHAEAMALTAAGGKAKGATAYVTLEPHNFQGRTPPCTDRLIAAGVKRVVVGVVDPNPRVDGGGIKQLRAAGIDVTLGTLGDECAEQLRGYLHFWRTKRPLVTLKAAVTLDGRLAARGGDSRWVSGDESRLQAHRMRDTMDAILVGAGTVRADDPSLTTRLPRGGRDAQRVILDGKLTISPRAKAVPGAWIVTTKDAPESRAKRLVAHGAEVVRVRGRDGRVALPALVDELGRRGILTLLVEGGGEVHGAFLSAGLADRVVLFIAPKIIGAGGVPLISTAGPRKMADAWRLGAVSTRRLGDDILVAGDVLRSR